MGHHWHPGLDLWFVHRMLLLPYAQTTCEYRRTRFLSAFTASNGALIPLTSAGGQRDRLKKWITNEWRAIRKL
jgi:hypothetical protein